jgi:hypothetical protein
MHSPMMRGRSASGSVFTPVTRFTRPTFLWHHGSLRDAYSQSGTACTATTQTVGGTASSWTTFAFAVGARVS